MRPLELTLRGFRSHVDETSFDFEDRSLLAIVGPTGAGKSTILDGISYALYAKTPRQQKSSRNLISTRSKKATVTYRFAIGADTYQINRSIPAASDDHMIEIDSGEKVIGSTAITTRVEELLGLDFDGFASSVLLAQGRFDLFLKATTKERTGILKGIFRIERIDELRKAAVGRRDGVDDELNKIEGERRGIPDDAADRLKASKGEIAALETRIAELEKALPEESGLLAQEKDALKEKTEAEGEVVALTEAVKRLPSTELLEELSERESACAATTKDATATFESCTKAAEKATKDLDALQKSLGAPKDLHAARAKAEGVAARETEMTDLEAELSALKKTIVATDAEVERAQAAEVEAASSVDTARSALDELNRIHAAHGLRSTLVSGEPCPVCEQTVATIPKAKKAGDLGKAETALENAEKALTKARESASEVRKRAAVERDRSGSLTDAHAKVAAAVAEARAAIEGVVGKVKDPVAEIDDRLEKLDAATAAREAAFESRERAQRSLNDCASTKQSLDKERQRYAEVLIQLAVSLKVTAPSVEDPAASLIEKIDEMAGRASEQGEGLRARIEKAMVMVKEAGEALAALHDRVGVDKPFADALADARTQRGIKEHEIGDLAAKIARAKELDAHEKELKTKRALFHQLADDLTDRHFVNFLLEDRRRLLSELASERLHEMTKRYRFTDDGEFNIVDELEGDVERGTDTLSGGETFLASLALALGLAETAARHGGRLQSFFLDEGFDSLDAEMLDQALDGIERIVTSDRLIALVSHVPALAARVEDKIVLGKDPEGSTVVLEGASK
jgi:exonuclease SbcC